MNIVDTLVQLRDDIKTWVTNNINALNAKIDEKTIPIDNELSSTSTNPVQNKAITNAINNIPKFSGSYNDLTDAPNIAEDDSGNMVITDEAGNIIFKADANGIHTTTVSLDGEVAASEKYVNEAIANIEFPTIDLSSKADLIDGKVPLSQLPEMSIDTSEFATKEDLNQKLDTYYGDNTFPYSEQGYDTDMEEDMVYTVSSVRYDEETIYFEEGTYVSFWFDYDSWASQVKSGDKIVLSRNENDDGYLYLNPIMSAKDISDEISELSKELDNKISKTEEVFVFSYDTRVESFDPTEYSFPYDEILTVSSVEEDGEFERWDSEYGDYVYETAYLVRFEEQDDFTLRCILYPSDKIIVGTKLIIKQGYYDAAYEAYYPDIYRFDEASLGVTAIVSSNQSFEYSDVLSDTTISFIDTAMGYETVMFTGDINLDKPTLYAGTNSKCFVTISYTRDEVWDEESEMYDGSLSGDGYWMTIGPAGDFELTIDIPYDEEGRYDGQTIYLATECKQGLTEIPVSKIKAGEGIKFAENNGILEISTISTPSADEDVDTNIMPSIKSTSGINTVTLKNDISPMTHELNVKLSSELELIDEVTNWDMGSWNGSNVLGDYIIESIGENSSESGSGEFTIYFTDGSELYVGMYMGNDVANVKVGDVIRFAIDPMGLYDSEWRACLYRGITDFSTITLTISDGEEAVATYVPNANGTVKGVMSLYPTTILSTSIGDITINVDYLSSTDSITNPVNTEPVVGANIVDMLRFSKQTLTDAQKAQVIENLGLVDFIRSFIQTDEVAQAIVEQKLDTIAEEESW